MTNEGQAMILESFHAWHDEDISDEDLLKWFKFLKSLENSTEERAVVPEELQHVIEKIHARSVKPTVKH